MMLKIQWVSQVIHFHPVPGPLLPLHINRHSLGGKFVIHTSHLSVHLSHLYELCVANKSSSVHKTFTVSNKTEKWCNYIPKPCCSITVFTLRALHKEIPSKVKLPNPAVLAWLSHIWFVSVSRPSCSKLEKIQGCDLKSLLQLVFHTQ